MNARCARWLRVPIGVRQFEEQPINHNTAAIERRTRAVPSFALLRSAGGEATGVARRIVRMGRSVCLNCGRMDRLSFADETVRHGRYGIAVVVVCRCQVTIVSKVMQGSVRPGMRRGHFRNSETQTVG